MDNDQKAEHLDENKHAIDFQSGTIIIIGVIKSRGVNNDSWGKNWQTNNDDDDDDVYNSNEDGHDWVW